MDFTDFVPLAPAEEYFFPPKDIYCQGRDATVPLGDFVELPSYFSFQKETLISRDGVQYSMPATVSSATSLIMDVALLLFTEKKSWFYCF